MDGSVEVDLRSRQLQRGAGRSLGLCRGDLDRRRTGAQQQCQRQGAGVSDSESVSEPHSLKTQMAGVRRFLCAEAFSSRNPLTNLRAALLPLAQTKTAITHAVL